MLSGINGNTNAVRKLNYTLLFMKYYICSIKPEEESLSVEEFVRKMSLIAEPAELHS